MEEDFKASLERFNDEFSRMGKNMETLGDQFAKISRFINQQKCLFRNE